MDVEAPDHPFLLDVRVLPAAEKHSTIRERFDALEPGQSLTLVNDHDPQPLYYELEAEEPDRFAADQYVSYQASEKVFVAVLPTKP